MDMSRAGDPLPPRRRHRAPRPSPAGQSLAAPGPAAATPAPATPAPAAAPAADGSNSPLAASSAAARPGQRRSQCGEPGLEWRAPPLSGQETAIIISLAEIALAFVEGCRRAPDRAALTRLTGRFARSSGFTGFVYSAARRDCRPYFLEDTVLRDAPDSAATGGGAVLPEVATLAGVLAAARPRPVRLADGRAAVVAPVHGPEGLKAMLLLISDAGMAAVVDRLRLGSASLQLAASHLYMAAEALRLAELQGRPARQPTPDLTPRERECMLWLARGKTAWEVARILGIRERTVTFHVENVKRKLGVSRRSQAIALLLQSGELSA